MLLLHKLIENFSETYLVHHRAQYSLYVFYVGGFRGTGGTVGMAFIACVCCVMYI